MPTLYAVVDCNNFFVSCERAFNPSLEGKPVIVLSNNDGCAVSRSDEAKALGIPMGVPAFKIKDLIKEKKVQVFSSNFELYGDMSSRIMKTLEDCAPTVEYYSVDEAFLPLRFVTTEDYSIWAEQVRHKIVSHTGIPVSIGIGSTRTLAKIANEFAKKWAVCNGVFSFAGMSQQQIDHYLQQLPVEAIWGVGYKSARVLNQAKIMTAYDLTQTNEQTIRKYLKVMGVRTRAELLGTSCAAFSENRAPKKGITSSRSFGERLTELADLEAAVASYVDTACHKLRKQSSVAHFLTVYIRTSYHTKSEPYYGNAKTVGLEVASNYTPTFIAHAKALLKQIYKPGVRYAKAGIFLSGIHSQATIQQHLYLEKENAAVPIRQQVSAALDAVRSRYGRRSIGYAASTTRTHWQGKSQQRTPRFTTHLTELLRAY